MNTKKILFLILFCLALVSSAQAQIQHVQMRVEGMT
jgi:hypothetical protein